MPEQKYDDRAKLKLSDKLYPYKRTSRLWNISYCFENVEKKSVTEVDTVLGTLFKTGQRVTEKEEV